MTDLLLINGDIQTLDPLNPVAEAMVVENGRIKYIGDSEAALSLRKPGARLVHLDGACALPGLTDSHIHLRSMGQQLAGALLSLHGASSKEEIVRLVGEYAAARNQEAWIEGQGWHQDRLRDRREPTHKFLSEAFPDRPVWLIHEDGHIGLANMKAMELSGVLGHASGLPPEVVRDNVGSPTGIFKEGAMSLIGSSMPPSSRQEVKRWLMAAQEGCLRAGLTQVHHAGEFRDPEIDLDAYLELEVEGQLNIRVFFMALHTWFMRHKFLPIERGLFTMKAVKVVSDGALGSRKAALLSPYTDDPSEQGLLHISEGRLVEVFEKAHHLGFPVVAVHAIGDRANRMVLDADRRFRACLPEGANRRLRIEHAQVLAPDDLARLSAQGIIASMQPIHAVEDQDFAERRLGSERIRTAYAWRKILESGARIAAGSDYPYGASTFSPLAGIHAAVTRQDSAGRPEGGWLPDQRMTVQEAVRAFTSAGAYASLQEDRLGKLTCGRLADITVLDRNPFVTPHEQLPQSSALMTIVNGHIAHSLMPGS